MTPAGSRGDTSIERDPFFQAPPRRGKAFRLALACAIVAIGGIGGFTSSNVAASTLTPLQDPGGPGGATNSAVVLLATDVESEPASGDRGIHCPPCPTP